MRRLWSGVFLAICIIPLAALSQNTLKVDVSLVNVNFTVRDASGRFVPGLKQEDFTVEEDGRKQEIQRFSVENQLPLTIGMLIDTSPSVSSVFNDEKDTAIRFLDSTLRPDDLAMVINFDREVTLDQDLTNDKRKLRSAIDDLRTGNGTAIYDAIYLACNEVLIKEGGRKAIILISDGQDTASKVRQSEAMVAAAKSEAVIYSISNRIGGFFGIRGSGDPETLKKFSLDTGGTVYFIGGRNDLEHVFEQIAEELRSQYTLAYSPSNTAKDGKFRSIHIIPKDSQYKIKARNGYYAPAG
jgi:VWFA-related protein